MRFSGDSSAVAAWQTDGVIGKKLKKHCLAGRAISWQDLQ